MPERKESWATSEKLAEGHGKMAQAVVTDLQGCLGDVVSAGRQEFGGALQAGLTQELLDGEPGRAGKLAAEVERAATDQPAQLPEGGRIAQARPQNFLDALCALAGGTLLTGAKQFSIGRAEE